MFFIGGTRKGTIRTYNDHQHSCPSCNAFDMEVNVKSDYFHVFFIPVFPLDNKEVRMHCINCGAPFRLFALEKEYEKKTKAPFYFYTISLLFLFLVLFIVFKILTE